MASRRSWVAAVGVLTGMVTLPCSAQTLDKGHRILLERGLQVQGMVANYAPFHLDTYQACGFTGVHWIWDSTMDWLGPPPGVPWARWARSPAEMPFRSGEEAYAGALMAVQIGDEQNLNDPTVRASVAQWYDSVRNQFPDAILFCNSYGGQVNNPSLGDFIQTSRPDMLSFDTYPFRPGEPAGGSPTHLYGDMQRYRKWALGTGIPYGMYTQTFHDSTVRDPSESELRLNYFAGVAFGYTYFTAFTYNTGASSLFNGPGDSGPKPAYYQLAETHRRLRVLSPALTRLLNTDVRFINGQYRDPTTGQPVSNPTPIDVQHWQLGVGDPYLRAWAITNVGTTNNGLPGDVWLSWFRVLDESFDGPDYNGEIYFMVTNGLSDANGSAADCRQQIRLEFQFTNPSQACVLRLNQQTGIAEPMELPIIPNSGGRRDLTLTYDGGTGELFKFQTGAPFVGVPTQPDTTPPAPVTGFTVQPSVEQATLSWTNPITSDFKGTLIRRKQGSYPANATDGVLVVDKTGVPGSSEQFVDTDVPGTFTWYYAAFAHDAIPNHAAAAKGSGLIRHRADFDGDNDVDQSDYSFLQQCLSGDRIPHSAGCSAADQDGDGDVDAADVALFAGCMGGASSLPGC